MSACKPIRQFCHHAATQIESPSCCAAVTAQLRAVEAEIFRLQRCLRELLDSVCLVQPATLKTSQEYHLPNNESDSSTLSGTKQVVELDTNTDKEVCVEDSDEEQCNADSVQDNQHGEGAAQGAAAEETLTGGQLATLVIHQDTGMFVDVCGEGKEENEKDLSTKNGPQNTGCFGQLNGNVASCSANDANVNNEEDSLILAIKLEEVDPADEFIDSTDDSDMSDQPIFGARRSKRQRVQRSCWQCPARFPNWKKLREHTVSKHPGTGAHLCICGRNLSTPSVLGRHYRCVHMKEKRFCCEVCGKLYTAMGSLRSHARKHHTEASAALPDGSSNAKVPPPPENLTLNN